MLPLNAACLVHSMVCFCYVHSIYDIFKMIQLKGFVIMCGFLILTFLIYTIVHLPAKPSRESLKKMRGEWFESVDASVAAFLGQLELRGT